LKTLQLRITNSEVALMLLVGQQEGHLPCDEVSKIKTV